MSNLNRKDVDKIWYGGSKAWTVKEYASKAMRRRWLDMQRSPRPRRRTADEERRLVITLMHANGFSLSSLSNQLRGRRPSVFQGFGYLTNIYEKTSRFPRSRPTCNQCGYFLTDLTDRRLAWVRVPEADAKPSLRGVDRGITLH